VVSSDFLLVDKETDGGMTLSHAIVPFSSQLSLLYRYVSVTVAANLVR
jgi:hypothetical protein